MKKILFLFALLMMGTNLHAAVFDHSAWNTLLKRNVVVLPGGNATQVNYRGMQADRVALKAYLDTLSSVTTDTFAAWSKQEQLAFLINAYNAWTVQLILSGYPDIKSIKDLGSLLQSPWSKEFISLLGKARSLDDIEHELIRAPGIYMEPRVHFAVNCASIGCPALQPEAFTGERLAAQLDAAAAGFLSDHSRNRLLGDTLQVSNIFKWYREDFEKGWGGFNSLQDFFTAYRENLQISEADISALKSGKLDIEFLDYDWRLNSTP